MEEKNRHGKTFENRAMQPVIHTLRTMKSVLEPVKSTPEVAHRLCPTKHSLTVNLKKTRVT